MQSKLLLFSFTLFLCFASWGRSFDASVNRLFVPTTSFSNAVVAVSKFTEHNREMGSVIALESHRTVASTNEWWKVEMIDGLGRYRFATVKGGVVTNCEFGVSPNVSMRQEGMSMPVLDISEIYHRFTLRYPQHEAVIGCRYGLHSGTWYISCLGMLYTISPGGEWKDIPDPLPKSRKSGHKMPEVVGFKKKLRLFMARALTTEEVDAVLENSDLQLREEDATFHRYLMDEIDSDQEHHGSVPKAACRLHGIVDAAA